MDLVVGQLGTELVKSSTAFVAQNQVKLKEKLQYPNKGCDFPTNMILQAKQVNQSPYPTSRQGALKLEPTLTLLTTQYLNRSREKRQTQPQLLKTSPQNTPKAAKSVHNLRNRNKDLTQKFGQKQSPTLILTSRITWTEQERMEERREGRDLENREIDKEDREISDRNGGQTARYLEQSETINLKKSHPIKNNPPIETQLKRKVEDSKEFGIILEEELKENIEIPVKKGRIKRNNLKLTIRKANGKCRKILDTKPLNKQNADFHFKMHDSNKEKQTIRLEDWDTSLALSFAFLHLIVQIESQSYLAFEFKNNHFAYRAMPFGIIHSPIYFATAIQPIMQQIKMKTEIRIINQVDDIFLLHLTKEFLKNLNLKIIHSLKYFGFTINTEKSDIQPKQKVIFLGWEWNLANATVKTKLKKRLHLLHDLHNMRKLKNTGIEIIVKQTDKLIRKLRRLRLKFQDAQLFLNTMDHQRAQAAILKGWNTTMTMNLSAIPDINL
ncbi:MAG: hypothetical protein EZS28_016432 [Streblomastix strix]|uniref:Reverse transcriptase domain-containing protein n=1 Tax=Streblomastix strix TaxID=222440 RepID=A0A5J4W0N1_9EUKA|nr:MAG: hypothetical protein EZS28_016432 [Streblomastix strix]